jgi:hypothetical protein
MSVHTEADERLDKARERIAAAVKNFGAIIVDQCWCHDEYRAEVRAKTDEAFMTLMRLRGEL